MHQRPPTQGPSTHVPALRRVLQRTRLRTKALVLGLPAVALLSFIAFSAGTPASIPQVNLAADPLYAAASGDKATLALALSVEFPTVGAQYVGAANNSTDNGYSSATPYLGYYDAESCYTYNNAPTETAPTGMGTADLKRFDRQGPATARQCTDGFSGNFLNWASNSAVDMLRLALSGGDRYIDTPTLTVLQRAIVPNGDPICMWNSTNFPAKQLLKDGGATGTYWGAVPRAMITQAAGSDIWVANTLNRIYFGTSKTGSCTDTTAYKLGTPPATTATPMGPIETRTSGRPSGTWTTCMSGESGSCTFTGIKEIWYGQIGRSNWKVVPASNGFSCGTSCNVTLGDPDSGFAKAVYYRDYTGSWRPPVPPTALNSDGFFYARAQVCNVNASGVLQDVRDYDLCRQYPNGNYKPGGAIQKYGDQLRLAAFGYVLDQTASYSAGRYGGVLRAPMKYVGAKTFDENGIDNTPATGNPAMEWNPLTGVFHANPDNDTTQTPRISGVINYLNKFGRTGTVPGRYKKYDPVGELHYEALRYLQGLQPSADAISGLTTAMYDGFPLLTTWADPYGGARTNASDYSCLKSNIVVIGDINTHDGNRLPTPSAANNIPDLNAWRSVVQNFEKNVATSYVDGQGVARNTGNPNGANTSVPSATDRSQIMGSAYWAHTHDIRGTGWTGAPAKQRPGLRVKTFIFDVNENGTETNTTTRRTANQFFMAAKYGGFESIRPASGGNAYNTMGNPFKENDNTTTNNNVWQKPAEPGEASTYYLQSSARGVLSAFDDIFSRATSTANNIGGSGLVSRNLTTSGDKRIYQGSFDTSDWSGDVSAVPIAVSTSDGIDFGTRLWSAADRLTTRASPATSRTIVVGAGGSNPNPTAVPFLWDSIGSAMQDALHRPDPDVAVGDGRGQRRLNYLRGDRTDEISASAVFRLRNKLLGDIVNSGVAYSGTPELGIAAPGYGAFARSHATRAPAVFVGANDGMLHAFNAATGDELFGYIPSWVVPRLSALTSKTYAANHRSYVDAPPVVASADISRGSTPDWRTLLLSGTGGGGKGVFLLDVTNPASFSASNVRWEFSAAHDVDMGYVVGQPQILRLRTSAAGAAATYKWFAVVASGVNNYVGAVGGDYSEGRPALFLLDLSKPVGEAWARGTNYYKISLPVDSTLSATTATGLLNFKPEFGQAGDVVRIYMGDLHGKLWRLDFGQAAGPADWCLNKLSPFQSGTAGDCAASSTVTALPLFIARDTTGRPQPITMAPTIAFSGSSRANYVAFGTGKYLEVADKTSAAQQSFYVLYDDIVTTGQTPDAGATASLLAGRSVLKAGTVNATARTVGVDSFRWGRRSGTTGSVYSGWYFDFPDRAERLISNIVVNGDLLEFNTLYPADTTGAVCGSNDGGGNSYALNMDTGSGTFIRSTVGVLGEAVVLQTKIEESATDSAGRRIRRITTTSTQFGAQGAGNQKTSTQDIVAGRLSWRRINNYQDLKN